MLFNFLYNGEEECLIEGAASPTQIQPVVGSIREAGLHGGVHGVQGLGIGGHQGCSSHARIRGVARLVQELGSSQTTAWNFAEL